MKSSSAKSVRSPTKLVFECSSIKTHSENIVRINLDRPSFISSRIRLKQMINATENLPELKPETSEETRRIDFMTRLSIELDRWSKVRNLPLLDYWDEFSRLPKERIYIKHKILSKSNGICHGSEIPIDYQELYSLESHFEKCRIRSL